MRSALFFSMLLAFQCLNAQNKLPAKRVTIFKNGTAMLVREGSVPVQNATVNLSIPAQTLFGSYFIGSGKDNAVKNMLFKNDTLRKPERSKAVWQYLAGNINKQAVIFYTPEEGIDKSATGKVTGYDLYSGMLTFATDAGRTLVLHADKVYAAEFKDTPSDTYMADSITRVMQLRLDKNTPDVSLQEVYMTSGFNWLPSYYLHLKDDKTARIEMKATVENYGEPIKDADVELVVGAPQMLYSAQLDPMTYDYISTTGFDNAGAMYKGRAAQYMQSNAMITMAAPAEAYFEESFTTDGEKVGDMYVYKLGKLTLPYKSKGTFPIFAGNIEYKDKYEGTISDITNFYGNRFVPADERTFDVFHSLEIKNTSTVPFTTAVVTVVNDKDQFTAQDELKYTPVGSVTDIRLSKAVDIIMKNSEEEESRTDNAKKIGKVIYNKAVIKGTVTLQNFQNKDVTVTVKKNLSGTVTAISDGGKNTKRDVYDYNNPANEIKWEVKLSANEKKKLSYTYEVLFVP